MCILFPDMPGFELQSAQFKLKSAHFKAKVVHMSVRLIIYPANLWRRQSVVMWQHHMLCRWNGALENNSSVPVPQNCACSPLWSSLRCNNIHVTVHQSSLEFPAAPTSAPKCRDNMVLLSAEKTAVLLRQSGEVSDLIVGVSESVRRMVLDPGTCTMHSKSSLAGINLYIPRVFGFLGAMV